MKPTVKNSGAAIAPIMHEYMIGGTQYIVKATVSARAREDAATKILRLLRQEINDIRYSVGNKQRVIWNIFVFGRQQAGYVLI